MSKILLSLFIFLCLTFSAAIAQTQQDTIYTKYTATPVVIDGSDSDACWAEAEWHAIDQVWLPHITSVMEEGDFEGRFKVAWDANYLYILVEVIDDSLSDNHKAPTDNYWNDDCVEIFIDENRSKGDHQYNYNAFAYHVSTYYDVIDGGTGTNLNLRNNLSVVMDTIAEHTYLWEFAVKMFDASFNPNNIEASRVKLTPNKLMGFSIAYCDNDAAADKQRENFIGSMIMTEEHRNDNYITANYFGSMLLVDPKNEFVSAKATLDAKKKFTLYPNPVSNFITVSVPENTSSPVMLSILSANGTSIREMELHETHNKIDLNEIARGIYLVRLTSGTYCQTETITKQ